MSKFIEVDIANTDSKTLVNVDQIVNVGRYKSDNTGYISFNSSGGVYENCIHTKQSYDELKKRIESAMELLEYNEHVDPALQALEILKGEETK